MAASDDFDTILAQLRARILAVTAANNVDYTVGGKTVSKGTYLTQLRESYRELLNLRQDADGAWQIEARGVCG
jgi:hypothetical protein